MKDNAIFNHKIEILDIKFFSCQFSFHPIHDKLNMEICVNWKNKNKLSKKLFQHNCKIYATEQEIFFSIEFSNLNPKNDDSKLHFRKTNNNKKISNQTGSNYTPLKTYKKNL